MGGDTEDALMAQMTWRIHSLLSIVGLEGGKREAIGQKGKEKKNNGALMGQKMRANIFICYFLSEGHV